MIPVEDFEKLIQRRYPQSEIKKEDKGTAPGNPTIRRISLSANLLGAKVQFNIGENLTLLVNGSPREVYKNLPLANPNHVLEEVEVWLSSLSVYLAKRELPRVKDFARFYLGDEESTEKKKDALYVYYKLYHVIITPTSCHLVLRSSNRQVLFRKTGNEDEIEDFFKSAKYYAEHICNGNIK
ncbi:MAG: hypothetical protein ABIF10_06455 [Candidatus Woesearchaeota archaeon]